MGLWHSPSLHTIQELKGHHIVSDVFVSLLGIFSTVFDQFVLAPFVYIFNHVSFFGNFWLILFWLLFFVPL